MNVFRLFYMGNILLYYLYTVIVNIDLIYNCIYVCMYRSNKKSLEYFFDCCSIRCNKINDNNNKSDITLENK